jgi:phospholipid/cholesterol/gamma-HCH transport system substrate-binding protein
MKNNSGRKTVLGIFIIGALAFFVAGIYYIGKKQQLFNDTFRISGVFKDVRGLQVGNSVRFAGINVGVVEEITIVTDTSVRVDMLIDDNTRKFIRRDASVIIGSDGLMGNKILQIMPGTPGERVIENNDYIRTTAPLNMDDIFAKLKVTGDNAASITSDLAVIVGNIRNGRGTIGKLFMDSTFATNLDKTVVHLKQGASGFSQNMEAAQHSFLLRGLFKKKKKDADRKKEENKEGTKKDDKKKEDSESGAAKKKGMKAWLQRTF